MRKAAIAIIFSKNEQEVLLVKRRDVPVWVLPGGGIEDNEAPEDAACREAFEETGVAVKIIRQVGAYTPINRLARDTFVFACEPIDMPYGDIQNLAPQEESQAVGFFPLKCLPKPFFFLHEEWLKDALLNQPEIIKRPICSISWYNLIKNIIKHPILIGRYLLSRCRKPINQ